MKTRILIVFTIMFIGLAHSGFDNENNFLAKANEISLELTPHYNIEELSIKIKDVDSGSAEARRYFYKYVIILDYGKLQNFSENQLKGLLAHEMAHLEYYSDKNYVEVIFLALRYLTSPQFRTYIEREADYTAIKKGFGEELLDYRIHRIETASNKDLEILKEHYLSPDEIILMLNKSL